MLKILGQAAVVGIAAFVIAVGALYVWRCNFQPGDTPKIVAKQQAEQTTSSDGTKTLGEGLQLFFNAILAGVAVLQIFLVLNANNSAKRSADAAIVAANAASTGNDLNRQTLIADQRPWVAVSIEPAGPVTWVNGSARIPYKIALKNIGKTPALKLRHIEAIVLSLNADLAAEQTNWRRMVDAQAGFGAINLMPGDEVAMVVTTQVNAQDIERAAVPWAGEGPPLIQFVLVGAADYFTQFDANVRTTGFIYEIGFWDQAKGITVTAIDPKHDGDIPIDRVRIRRRPDVDGLVN